MEKNPYEEHLKKLKPLIDFGFRSLKITYNGGGDEGAVDEIEIDFTKHGVSPEKSRSFEPVLTDFANEILEQTEGGWELDEGSEGTITISQEQEGIKIKVAHTRFYRESEEAYHKFDFKYEEIFQ